MVDDASTDATAQVMKEVTDPRVRFIPLTVNAGAAAARNTGIRAAQGELIAFQDAGDEWLPEKVEKQVAVMQSSPASVGVVYCAIAHQVAESSPFVRYPPPHIKTLHGNVHRSLCREGFIGTPTLLVRRDCFEHVGMFDEAFPRFQDWELEIRLSQVYTFAFVDEVLVRAHFYPGSISSGHTPALLEAERLLMKKHAHTFQQTGSSLYAYRLFRLGHIEMMLGSARAARRCILAAFSRHARALYAVAFVLSLFPWGYRWVYTMVQRDL